MPRFQRHLLFATLCAGSDGCFGRLAFACLWRRRRCFRYLNSFRLSLCANRGDRSLLVVKGQSFRELAFLGAAPVRREQAQLIEALAQFVV